MNTTLPLILLALALVGLLAALTIPHWKPDRAKKTKWISTVRLLAGDFMLGAQEALVVPARLWARLKYRKLKLRFAANIAEGVYRDSITKLSAAAIATRHLLYVRGADDRHITAAGDSDALAPMGTVADEASAAEENVAVQILGKGPTKRMVASEAMTVGDEVWTAASGKVQDRSALAATYWIVGTALTAAAADGDIIEVADCVPIRITVI